MGSILKALGLTIWGLIALGLLAVFIFVGFEAVLKYRVANNTQSEDERSGPSGGIGPSLPALSAPASSAAEDRSQEAASSSTRLQDDSAGCGRKPRTVLDPAQGARIEQLLSGTEAAKADSGGPLVRLGELYYGYGEYELAIAAIQLGLQKGRIAQLDDAYVYLGRAELAVGDVEEARNAFKKLKDVPGISPRVLRLWTLYAETLGTGQCP